MADYLQTGRMFDSPEAKIIPLSAEMVQGSFLNAKSLAEVARKIEAEKRLEVYEDDFAEILEDRIGEIWKAPNAKDLIKVLDKTNNPLKRIVNEISTLYARPPVWSFATPRTAPTWRSIMQSANADAFFPELNRMVNLLNTALVYVRPSKQKNRLVFKIVLPQDVTVWADPDDPAMPLAAMFRECDPSSPNALPTWHLWDRRSGKVEYRKFTANQEEDRSAALTLPYEDELGPVLPIVAYHRRMPTWSFWDTTSGDDLFELTVMIAVHETFMNHLVRTDAYRQKYSNGPISEESGDQTGGTTSVLQFSAVGGGPLQVGEFSSQADWDGLGGVGTRKLENVLNNYGLALSDFRTSGDATSGFSLRVRKEGLIEIRERQMPIFRTWDMALYRVVAAVWNFERNNAQWSLSGDALPEPSVAKPSVRYASLQTAQTVEEREVELRLQKERIALGLESPITIFLAENPGATEEEARAAITKNMADSESFKPKPAENPVVPAVGGGEDTEDPKETPAPE